jgi:hypothetical protein
MIRDTTKIYHKLFQNYSHGRHTELLMVKTAIINCKLELLRKSLFAILRNTLSF